MISIDDFDAQAKNKLIRRVRIAAIDQLSHKQSLNDIRTEIIKNASQKISNQTPLSPDEVEAFTHETLKKYPLSQKDADIQALSHNVLVNTIDNGTGYPAKKAPYFFSDASREWLHGNHSHFVSLIRGSYHQVNNRPANIEDDKLLTALSLGEFDLLLNNLFQQTGLNNVDATRVTDFVVGRTADAILNHKEQPLEEFYGRNDPKQLRGQVKAGSQSIFKTTTDLKNFLTKTFLI